ncbi:MAG: NUDIX hydrolase [Ignavibacteriales bacterium]|nr:NUDIX hydrolase [Ignavibacteriales bacterium]
MPLRPWKKIRTAIELKNPWWTYRKDEVELPSGREGEYHYVHVEGSSMVIPVLEDGRMVLVNQYRYLLNKESIEFPCGSVKEGDIHENTARLELAEETGYGADELACVAEFNPYNGVTDEICRVFIARGLKSVDVQPDETEEFEKIILNVDELEDKIRTGEIWDGMTLAAWAVVKPLLLE